MVAAAVKVMKLIYKLFAYAIDYKDYLLSKGLAKYKDEVANELEKLAIKTVVHVKEPMFYGKRLVSVSVFF